MTSYSFLENLVDAGLLSKTGDPSMNKDAQARVKPNPVRPVVKPMTPGSEKPGAGAPSYTSDASDTSDTSYASGRSGSFSPARATPNSLSLASGGKGLSGDYEDPGIKEFVHSLGVGGNNVAHMASNAGFNILSFLNWAANRYNNNMPYMPGRMGMALGLGNALQLPEDKTDRWIENWRGRNDKYYDSGEYGELAKALREKSPTYGAISKVVEESLSAIPMAATGDAVGRHFAWLSSKIPWNRVASNAQRIGDAARFLWTAGPVLTDDPTVSREFTRFGYGDLDTSWDKRARQAEGRGDLGDYPYDEAKRFYDEHGAWPIYMDGKPYQYYNGEGQLVTAMDPNIYRAATGNIASLDAGEWYKSRALGPLSGSIYGDLTGIPRYDMLRQTPIHVDENGFYAGGMAPTPKLDEGGATPSTMYDDMMIDLARRYPKTMGWAGGYDPRFFARFLPWLVAPQATIPAHVANGWGHGDTLGPVVDTMLFSHPVSGAVPAVRNAARGVYSRLPGVVRDVASSAASRVRNAVSPVVSGVRNAVSRLPGPVRGVAAGTMSFPVRTVGSAAEMSPFVMSGMAEDWLDEHGAVGHGRSEIPKDPIRDVYTDVIDADMFRNAYYDLLDWRQDMSAQGHIQAASDLASGLSQVVRTRSDREKLREVSAVLGDPDASAEDVFGSILSLSDTVGRLGMRDLSAALSRLVPENVRKGVGSLDAGDAAMTRSEGYQTPEVMSQLQQ